MYITNGCFVSNLAIRPMRYEVTLMGSLLTMKRPSICWQPTHKVSIHYGNIF